MEQELKNDLIAAYWEIRIAKADFNCGDLMAMGQRLDKALHWLGKYVSADDTLEDIK